MRQISARIRTGRGYTIALTAVVPARSRAQPLVVVCHGIGVDSKKPLIGSIRDALLRDGYGVVQFDFAGHGQSGGGIQQRLVGMFIRDLSTVIDWLAEKNISNQEGVVVVGHSIGALTALLYAGSRPTRLRAIALIGCNARSKKKFKELLARKVLRFERTYWVVGRAKVARSFWTERNRYEPRLHAGKIRVPVLLMCGSKDVTNPPRESRLLYQWIRTRKKLAIIPGTDHYFKSEQSRLRAARVIQTWLKSGI